MTYTLEELQAPSYEISDKGITATRHMRLADWADVDEYMDDLFPSGIPTGGVPYRPGNATFPGRSSLVLKSVSIEAFDQNQISGTDTHGRAMCGSGADIKLEYGTLDYAENEDKQDPEEPATWLTHDINVQQQYMTHAQSALKWMSDDAGVHEDVLPGFPMMVVNHDMTWHRVPNPPLEYWYGFVGKCNATKFINHEAEIVLFSGFSANRQAKTDGTSDYEVKMTFQARIIHGTPAAGSSYIGWNHFLRPEGTWDRIVDKMDNYMIPSANLNLVFQYS